MIIHKSAEDYREQILILLEATGYAHAESPDKTMATEKTENAANLWPGEKKSPRNLLKINSPEDRMLRIDYSHSTLAGGLVVTSRTTRLTWGTSLTIRAETVAIVSYGMRAQSAVMKSSVVTARRATV